MLRILILFLCILNNEIFGQEVKDKNNIQYDLEVGYQLNNLSITSLENFKLLDKWYNAKNSLFVGVGLTTKYKYFDITYNLRYNRFTYFNSNLSFPVSNTKNTLLSFNYLQLNPTINKTIFKYYKIGTGIYSNVYLFIDTPSFANKKRTLNSLLATEATFYSSKINNLSFGLNISATRMINKFSIKLNTFIPLTASAKYQILPEEVLKDEQLPYINNLRFFFINTNISLGFHF